MKLSQIVVDTKAQEEGEWRDHPYFDGVKVLVRSISSEAYRKRQTALQNRLPRRTRKTGDAIAAQLEIDRQARDVLVAGWTGIDDAEYSEETAREWAKDPKFRRFFDGVYELSLDIGPPYPPKPTWELLGETLLRLGRPAEARAAFERALELAPGRTLALTGLAEAAAGEGDEAGAAEARARLAGNLAGERSAAVP